MTKLKPRSAVFTVDVETPYPDGEQGVYDFLEIFNLENIKATFFVTGDVAQKSPEVVKAIIAEGHEVGSHGWRHPYISLPTKLRPPYLPDIEDGRLHQELEKSLRILKELGAEVHGFRAMQFLTDSRVSTAVARYFQYESSYSDKQLFKLQNKLGHNQLPIATLLGTNLVLGTPLLFGLPFKPVLKSLGLLTTSDPITIYSHSSDFIKCNVSLYTKRWKRIWYYNRCGPQRIKDVRSIICGLTDQGFVFETGKSYIDNRYK